MIFIIVDISVFATCRPYKITRTSSTEAMIEVKNDKKYREQHYSIVTTNYLNDLRILFHSCIKQQFPDRSVTFSKKFETRCSRITQQSQMPSWEKGISNLNNKKNSINRPMNRLRENCDQDFFADENVQMNKRNICFKK